MNKKQRDRNTDLQRQRQVEQLMALSQREGATTGDQQRLLGAQQQITNEPTAAKRTEARLGQEAADSAASDAGFRGKFKGALGDISSVGGSYSLATGKELDSGSNPDLQPLIHGEAETNANSGAAPKRNDGFINLYSRNFRRAAGEDQEEPDAQEWWLATGQLSPYIDAKADEELADGGEPGFWNMYSGLHNLVGKTALNIYGVSGG